MSLFGAMPRVSATPMSRWSGKTASPSCRSKLVPMEVASWPMPEKNLALAVEDREPLLEGAAQEHAVVEIEQSVGRSIRLESLRHGSPFARISRK